MINKNNFTIFKDFDETVSQTYRVSSFDTIKAILAGQVPELEVARITEEIKIETDKEQQTEIKKQLPFLTVSALYHPDAISKHLYPYLKDKYGRDLKDDKGNKIKGDTVQLDHSGFVCVDFDHLSTTELNILENSLRVWDATILLHVSPRGEGLKAYYAVDNITVENHTEVYKAFLLYLFDRFGVFADPSCTNVNRGTFLPYQPNFYYNGAYQQLNADDLLSIFPDAVPRLKTLKDIVEAGSELPTDLRTWDYNKKKLVVTKPVKTTVNQQVNTVSLLSDQDKFDKYTQHLIKQNGLPSEENGRHTFYLKLVNLKTEEIAPESILQMAIDWTATTAELVNPYTPEKIQEYLGRSLRDETGYEIPHFIFYPTQNQRSSKERITQKNIREIILQYFDFYHDEESDYYYYVDAGNNNPFEFKRFTTQSMVLNNWLGLLEDHSIFINKDYLRTTLFNTDTCKSINYMGYQLEYLYKNYDSKDHLTELLASVGTDNDNLFKEYFTKWSVYLVAQLLSKMNDHIRNDYALILVGKQGGGKTGFFERLLWNSNLFASKPSFNFDSTKDALLLNEKALVLLDEMSSYSKGDVKQMKHFFSQGKITGDRKYMDTADYKRNASFAGCSNNADILKDDTGDRRFLVFDFLNYDKARYNAVDKMQLWGQIVSMYKNGFVYSFENENDKIMKRNIEKYSTHKPEDSFIETQLTISYCPEDFMTNTELEQLIYEYTKEYNVKSFINISAIKAKLQFMGLDTQKVKKLKGKTVRGIVGVRDWKRVVNPDNYVSRKTEHRPVVDFDFNSEDREYKTTDGKTLSANEASSYQKILKAGGCDW